MTRRAPAFSIFCLGLMAGACGPPTPLDLDASSAPCAVSFESPTLPPGATEFVLGAMDDADGEVCGVSFFIDVVLATDAPVGSEVVVTVNGTLRATAPVTAASVRIEPIMLDNRGSTRNDVSVEVRTPGGATCSAALAPLYVDCEGASCEILEPREGTLDTSLDLVAGDGRFTLDVVLVTDTQGIGHPTSLTVDGVETSTTADPTGRTTFAAVELSVGTHEASASCTDDRGNTTGTARHRWVVTSAP